MTVLLSAHAPPPSAAGSGTVTLIHIGDIHGHLVPRPDALGPGSRTVGGVARMATVIARIRQAHPNQTLLVNVGDAVQGSAEALFTRGKAIVDVLEPLGIDAFIPGNWDYVYGIDRFVETFVGLNGAQPIAPWRSIASNLHYSAPDAGMRSRYLDLTGEPVLPPFVVRDVGGVRVGIIGITTTRGPRALGTESTRGFTFTSGEADLGPLITRLRAERSVDVIVVASELELANNLRIAESIAGIDVMLSADMHETTREPIIASTGTVIVEEGQDGVVVGELTLRVEKGKLASWNWALHEISDTIPDDPKTARVVEAIRKPLLANGWRAGRAPVNPINDVPLAGPIDQVVGYTTVALHRSLPATATLPAVIEGSSHDFLADAFRAAAEADVALIRGFRFGTHVRPGSITREALYHFLPIGGQVAVVDRVPGRVIWRQLESSLQGAIDPDPRQWTGGWLAGVSGMTMDVDPYAHAGARIRNLRVNGVPIDTVAGQYSVAGLWFASEPNAVSNCAPCVANGSRVRLMSGRDGARQDAVEVVATYLAGQRDSTVSPEIGRVRLLKPLPPSPYRFSEIQPLHGVGERKGLTGASK